MSSAERFTSIDELLDRAVAAINLGDPAMAAVLAEQVLAIDATNTDAEDLLAAPAHGEIRRLTILFADLVDSTALSTQVEPETYRFVVGRYRDLTLSAVNQFEGHIGSTKGDGLLAVFGHPVAHEDDARRAVLAGLEITRQVSRLSGQAKRRFGFDISVRVGVHRGLVYLDTVQDDVYGLGANLAARISGLALPGTVVVSNAVAPLIRRAFELQARPAALVKGVDEPIDHYRVLGELAVPVQTGRGPLVGRDREVARLQKYWERAQAGTLTTPGLVLRGEAGIGKSRLAAVAVELVQQAGVPVLELNGSSFGADAGLYPVRSLLEHRCGISRGIAPGERLRLLEAEVAACSLDRATSVPLLAPVLAIEPGHGYEPVPAEGRKLQMLISEAVQQYLLASLNGDAGLLVAEDVHWYDQSTLEVLGALLKASRGRLLVVITGRPGGWLPADWPVKVFDLAALTAEQTDALITTLDPGLSAPQRAAVADRCDGVPFYIEQVVAGFTEIGVPESLYEPLFARLQARANVVPVVEAAGVIGRYVDRGLLGAVCALGDDEIDDVIDELEDALVLEPWGTDGWRFRHELLREVATELAPPSVRRGLHAKVADALVQSAAGGYPDWRLVARHYDQAGRFDETASAYQQAAKAARRRGALGEARTYLTFAIAQLDCATPGPDRDRREIVARLERGFLAGAVEGHSSLDAAADFERCLKLGGTDPRSDEVIATLAALMGHYTVRAELHRAAQICGLLDAVLGEERQSFRPALEAMCGVGALMRGDFTVARGCFEQATAGEEAADQPQIDAMWFLPNEPIASAHVNLALADLMRGDLTRAEAGLARATSRVAQLGFPEGPYTRAYAGFVEIWIRIEAGQLDHAATLTTDLIDQAERDGLDQWRLVGAIQQGIINALASLGADDHDPAGLSACIATTAGSIDMMRAVGQNAYGTFWDAILGRLLIAAGQLDQARAHLDAALRLAEDTGMHFYDAELLRLRAQARSDPDGRESDVGAALELARRQGVTLFELRAALDDFELRGQPARAALFEAVGRFPGDNAWPEIAWAQTALDHVEQNAR
ncbi:MAG: AAA family ATPase [Mycobacterium sp.]